MSFRERLSPSLIYWPVSSSVYGLTAFDALFTVALLLYCFKYARLLCLFGTEELPESAGGLFSFLLQNHDCRPSPAVHDASLRKREKINKSWTKLQTRSNPWPKRFRVRVARNFPFRLGNLNVSFDWTWLDHPADRLKIIIINDETIKLGPIDSRILLDDHNKSILPALSCSGARGDYFFLFSFPALWLYRGPGRIP